MLPSRSSSTFLTQDLIKVGCEDRYRMEIEFTDTNFYMCLIIIFLLKEVIKKLASNRVTFKFVKVWGFVCTVGYLHIFFRFAAALYCGLLLVAVWSCSILRTVCYLLQCGTRPTPGAGTTGPRADVISSGARSRESGGTILRAACQGMLTAICFFQLKRKM
jgi:hypothetical protein